MAQDSVNSLTNLRNNHIEQDAKQEMHLEETKDFEVFLPEYYFPKQEEESCDVEIGGGSVSIKQEDDIKQEDVEQNRWDTIEDKDNILLLAEATKTELEESEKSIEEIKIENDEDSSEINIIPTVEICDEEILDTSGSTVQGVAVEGKSEPSNAGKALHKCDQCDYQTATKYALTRHSRIHKKHGRSVMYKCYQCNYQRRRKCDLADHYLVHKKPDEIASKKEDFQPLYIRCIVFNDNKTEEVTTHKCDQCDYQTIRKDLLTHHYLIHKKPAETSMHKCDQCDYKTVYKSGLTRHSLVHQRISMEAELFKCNQCDYQTIEAESLATHFLVHEKPEELTNYKCNHCDYQTIRKSSMSRHSLVHRKPGEASVYKCDQCDYHTLRKPHLAQHYIIHQKPEEVTKYKCDLCDYQTTRKFYLPRHMMTHQKPGETIMYKCDQCDFQTTSKTNLKKKHYIIHQKPEETDLHKCDRCGYQTVDKHSLTRHRCDHEKPGRDRLRTY